ncbi:MAG: PepSY-associated TM helix domain-containing protein [Pseudomonadota bacterium]
MIKVSEDFRRTMWWLHSWAGAGLAGLLFVIFWFGTLSVFDQEIDQWMKPELRITSGDNIALDPIALPQLQALDVAQGSEIMIVRPEQRWPTVDIYYTDRATGEDGFLRLDPHTGAALKQTNSLAATDFLFPMHYSLHASWQNIGYWIVAFAALSMLVLVISGVFIHRKIIEEFFTLRPKKPARRVILDLHTLFGVAALPFYVIMPLSGIMIFATTYFAGPLSLPFAGDLAAAERVLDNGFERPLAGQASTTSLGGIDTFIKRAEDIWRQASGAQGRERSDFVYLHNMHDENAYISVERYYERDGVGMALNHIAFDLKTGEILSLVNPTPVQQVLAWLKGFHFVQFDHWALRWLYFCGGLSGCIMIACGFLLWMNARLRKGAKAPAKVRAARAFTIGTMTGTLCATACFFIANRLLTNAAELAGFDRAALEVWAFFGVWIAAFAHAALRGRAAWKDQLWAIAVLTIAAAALNWITTGDWLMASMSQSLWAVAGMDIVLLTTALTALLTLKAMARQEAGLEKQSGSIGSSQMQPRMSGQAE